MSAPAVRSLAFGAVLLAAVLTATVRLGTATWHMDELIYRDAGLGYFRGDFSALTGHPPLGPYLYGLAALLGDSRPGAVRAPAVVASLGTGLVLFAFGRYLAGFWSGLAAFAIFALLPCTGWAGPERLALRIDRFALLDPLMGFFQTLALWLGWRWRDHGGHGRAAATGVALALAATSKVLGALVAPVILAAVLLHRGRRAMLECATFAGTVVVAAALVYVPFGQAAPAAIAAMVAMQSAHRAAGHPTIVADTFYLHPPWWTLLWWEWRGSGTPTVLGLAGAAVAALVVVPRAVCVYLLASIATTFGFLTLVAGIALSHYVYDWQAPLALLAGLALVALWRGGRSARVVAGGLLVLLAIGAATTAARLTQLVPRNYRVAGRTLIRAGLGRATVVAMGYDSIVRAYLPHATVVSEGGQLPDSVDVLVLDPVWASRFAAPKMTALLRAALPALAECRFDDLHVYVRAVPRGSALARHCTRPATLPPPTPGSRTGF